MNYLNGQVVDADIKRADVLIFKVPVDDENHIHFEVRSIPFTGNRAAEWLQRRREKRRQEATDRPHLVREVLAGWLHLDDIDPDRIDFVMVRMRSLRRGKVRFWIERTSTSDEAIPAYFSCARFGSASCGLFRRDGPPRNGPTGRMCFLPIRDQSGLRAAN